MKHVSVGEGKERFITVSKTNSLEEEVSRSPEKFAEEEVEFDEETVKEETESNDEQNLEIEQQSKDQQKIELKDEKSMKSAAAAAQQKVDKISVNSSSTVECPKCKKQVPQTNFALHDIRCRVDDTLTTSGDVIVRPKTASSKKPKKKKSASRSKSSKAEDSDDFDFLIAEANQLNTVCNYEKCKEYTTTLGQNCEFCRRRFCLKHHIAEVHGCGSAAKSSARAVVLREGVIHRGSGVPERKMDAHKRAYLHKKLDKKLSEYNDARKVKKKSGE